MTRGQKEQKSFFFPATFVHIYNVNLEHLQRCEVCGPAKYIFTCKFSYLFFCNPTHKTETGTANRWETTNSKPPGQIIMMGQSETLSSSQIITLLLFSAGGLLTSHHKVYNYAEPNYFPDPNRHVLTFLHPIFTLQDHILSTAGDANT